MKDFNLKKYLAEGRLLKENKTVTADMWAIMSDDQKMDALLTVFKDPDDAEIHVDKQWDDLPEERDYMSIFKVDSPQFFEDEIDMDKVFMNGVGPGGVDNPDKLTDEPKERDGMIYADEIDKWIPKEEYIKWLETRADDHYSEPLKEEAEDEIPF